MEEFAALLVFLGIGLFISGPIAIVLAIVLFNKLGGINRRLDKLEGKHIPGVDVYKPPVPKPAVPPVVQPQPIPVSPGPQPPVEEKLIPKPVEQPKPAQPIFQPAPTIASKSETPAPPAQPAYRPPKPQIPHPSVKPISEVAAAMKEFVPLKPKSADNGGLELKLGTTVALIIGVITVIIGVAFFLKYVYDNMTFSEEMRVCMVAVGGLAGVVIGEVLRRKNFEIVAKGIAALGFVLLYAAVFSGNYVYQLYEIQWTFVMLVVVTAAAMAYAVWLNEILIAFLALFGAYLLPTIILTGHHTILMGQNVTLLLFSYVFVLSAGTIGCAMFRRWRAVNWIAMVGTYLLYTIWFENVYSSDQLQTALFWLGLFGGMYLVLPILHGLFKKLIARSEDVTLIVVNSIAVYYYLWQMLSGGSRQDLAFASVVLGAAHIAMVFVVLWRCRDDNKLQSSLGVLGTAFITAAVPMYFNTLQPTLIGWSIEAVVLTFIGIRYNSLWTKVMSILVAVVASAGLFYHLPLHVSEDFKLVFNSPFGTWIFVGLAIMLCHGLWRFMRFGQTEERALMTQVYFVWGRLLLATGVALEWYAHCYHHIVETRAYFLMGMIVLAAILFIGFLTRPVCPKGDFVRTVGVMTMVAGSVFTGIAMMGVYYDQFKLFLNVPFLIAAGFVAVLYFGIWQVKRTATQSESQAQLPGALATMGMLLVLALLSEQIYMYWSCRDYYGEGVSNWQSVAFRYIFILWAVAGVAMLMAGIRFKKPGLKALSMAVSAISVIGLFAYLPLHIKGEFQFVYNQPFLTWVGVAVSLLIGHGLWRFMTQVKDKEGAAASQCYYAAGLVLLAVGCVMEWYAHCYSQVYPKSIGQSNFLQGVIILAGLAVLSFLARPLPPGGLLPKALGVLTALGGAVWTALVMSQVYEMRQGGFIIFANVPFLIAAAFVGAILLSAWFVKQNATDIQERFSLPAALVLGALILVWVLLSEQIYQYFWCKNQYVETLTNWRFLSQMYISVAWAIYAAVLIVIGFVFRAAGIRYLSLLIFAVLLGKINLDVWNMGSGYMVARIATFLTTGLILVGVSLLYQFLKNKGFFDVVGIQLKNINRED